MTAVDTRPQVLDIDHYAGNTLVIKVTVPDSVVAGRVWNAQVRSTSTSRRVEAVFDILPRSDGADVVLKADDTMRLAAKGEASFVWDVQLSMPDGGDPVTTLVRGDLRITPDVTRLEQ